MAHRIFAVQTWVKRQTANSPRLFFSFYTLRGKKLHLAVNRETELLIEGFPRCANTFSVVAFNSLQENPVRLAHHVHSVAQVLRALEYGVPVLVLIRNPTDAIASWLVRDNRVSVQAALKDYLAFYRPLLSLRERVEIADFSDITADFGSVIDRVNQRFDCSFSSHEMKDSDRDKVFSQIDDIARDKGRNPEQVSRPVDQRNALQETVRSSIAQDRYSKLLKAANDAYRELTV